MSNAGVEKTSKVLISEAMETAFPVGPARADNSRAGSHSDRTGRREAVSIVVGSILCMKNYQWKESNICATIDAGR